MLQFFPVNVWSVLAAAGASLLVGWVWHSKLMFHKEWIRAVAKDPKSKQAAELSTRRPTGTFITMSALSVLSSYVLAVLCANYGVLTSLEGAYLAFWIWAGVALPIIVGVVLSQNQDKNLIWIEGMHVLISLVVMGFVLGATY